MKDGTIKCSERDGEGASVTWEGWHPPLHLKFSGYFFYREVGQGEIIPPWYYGLSLDDSRTDTLTFHIIPFNFVIRAARWLEWTWAKLRCRRSYFDAQLLEAETRGFERGREYEKMFPSK
jgi:hypothetical protein